MMSGPDGCKGFSTLQATAGMALAGIFIGVSLQHLPQVLNDADREVTRHAASAEAMHNAVWSTWNRNAGADAEQTVPAPVRHGFEERNSLVHSPLDGYCFAPSDPLSTLDLCQSLTAE